jgi:serine/threonine-protein kinase
MLRRRHHCDASRLQLLLQENIPDDQQAELVDHLDGCEECQIAIEKLAADKHWWDELRRMSAPDLISGQAAIPTPALPTLTEPADAGKVADDPGQGPTLSFLDPPEDPTHLGRLGAFAITAVLGRGGMGIVLKAVDAALNRPVAIKVLAPHFASSGAARRRFAREAQAAAAVVHEHVVAIHSVDTWKGLPYLVMSYVDGRSLQERIDSDGPLDVKAILRIGMQAAAGLAAAHAQGLVHRDVKPANILLENGVERVRLTDFGLARAVDDASLTQSGVVAGTPQYMAPEQARGDAIDHRADLFSLGSTLYAMCTGHAPFRANSAMGVLRRVCDDRPRPIRDTNPDIPTWLAGVIARLHAKEAADRFQTAGEVAELLERCLAHVQQPASVPLPTNAFPDSARSRSTPWLFTGVMAATFLVMLSLGTVMAFHWTALGDYLFFSADTGEPDSQSSREPAIPAREENPLQFEVDVGEARRWAAALEADLRQPSTGGFGDPAEKLLLETRQLINALEKEVGALAP